MSMGPLPVPAETELAGSYLCEPLAKFLAKMSNIDNRNGSDLRRVTSLVFSQASR